MTGHEKSIKANSNKAEQDQTDQVYASKLTPEGGHIPSEAKYDTCVLVIYCATHQKVAVSRPDNVSATWLPFVPFPEGESWEAGAFNGALTVLTGGDPKYSALIREPQCMQVLRVQMPHTLGFITRLTYMIQLQTEANTDFKCCHNTKRIKWLSMEHILTEDVVGLWGPELVDCVRLIRAPTPPQVSEFSLDEAFLYVPRDPPRNAEEGMLKSIHLTEKDVERLYLDFVEHCFPAFAMTLDSFKSYMAKYGFERRDHRLLLLFKAFNYLDNGYLSFHELLIGLATIEPFTVHGQVRTRFLFRYYAGDGSGVMSVDRFRILVRDMNPTALPPVLEQKVAEGVATIGTKTIGGVEQITAEDFFQAIGSHRFRGTANLCRSSKPIFTQISRKMAARTLKKLTARQSVGSVIRPAFQGECITCKEKEYKLATHSVKINSEGRIVDPIPVVEHKRTEADSFTAPMYSTEYVFNKHSAANVLIKLVHQFNRVKGTNKDPKGLLADNPAFMWQLTVALANDIDVLLNEEDKCPRVFSPCYIIGDIHGNLEDLLSLERSIWKRFPCVGANYLFLGDYVDRGRWSLECALYIMALKILMPNKVTMLRGNHEVRLLQTAYTYKAECCGKYGEDYGQKVWELTNRVFDKLPVAAVVDDAIYCAHGGIPRSAKTIADINAVRRELANPEVESPVVWEILWSDPCHAQQFNDVCTFSRVNAAEQGGFVHNVKRSTAFLFNEQGATGFLQHNGLTHIVRAHEVPQRGYAFHFGQKCITIFSCSHYCGNDNACSCLLADSQVLRVIRLDTVNNAPATE